MIGSKILTLDGELPVEFLSAGDRVITRDAGMALLRDVLVFETECLMVSIKAGSLGHHRPDQDTRLSSTQKILLRDWRATALTGQPQALVAAQSLIDGEFIRAIGVQNTKLFQLVFDAAHIVYVDGLEMACEDIQEKVLAAA